LGAHVHGVAELLVALDGHHLTVTLDSPSYNVVGFEHFARHAADRALLLDAEEKLSASQNILTLASAAQCRIESVDITAEQLSQLAEAGHGHNHGHSHDHGHSHNEEQGHSEFVVNYHFHCDNPSALSGLTVQAFQHFPGFETIDVQWIIDGQQGATRAQANRTEVRF
jgi:hypothetical protein